MAKTKSKKKKRRRMLFLGLTSIIVIVATTFNIGKYWVEIYDKYKENPSFIRVKDRKGKNVSIIRFAEMIPVPQNAIQLLDFTSRGEKYRDLLEAERNFINDNREEIYSKAKKIYRNVTELKNPFFMSISCDFQLLEQKAKLLYKENNNNKKC